MTRKWPIVIFILSGILMMIQKSREVRSLNTFYNFEKPLKLKNFEHARKEVSKEDLEYLKLWESTLTGRSAPLSKLMKEQYKELALNHIFTPSGFHLSAILSPILKFFKGKRSELIILLSIGLVTSLLPGLAALKRMIMIKVGQNVFGKNSGFIVALLIDILWGSFQENTLSFTYSFLFLGIIYSGLEGLVIIVYFFIAQLLIAFFQGSDISPLLLLFSPALNLFFSLLMPILFILSIPLWAWQLKAGIFLLKITQNAVHFCAHILAHTPSIEINPIGFIILIMFQRKNWRLTLLLVFLYSHQLNQGQSIEPTIGRNEFLPQGEILSHVYLNDEVKVIFSDGRCRLKLVGGLWWENCSPRRRSSRKKIKKLSYPS